MQHVTADQRRARLGRRHHLAPEHRTADVVQLAAGVVGLHATDPAGVHLAAMARMPLASRDPLERALYEDHTLIRMLGMRRTLFVVPHEVAPVVHSACTQAIAVRERKLLVQLLGDAGIARDAGRWLRTVERATLAALEARGEATAAQLTKDVPGLREKIPFGEGKKWAGVMGVSTRVLVLLAAEGRIVRGRPNGSWISSQYRWAPMENWLGGPLPEVATLDAQAELVRRWLARFGPGTIADLKWWTGLKVAEVKQAVATVGATEVDLDGAPGLVLADDTEFEPSPDPWVALLPALDPTIMGWTERDWYLGPHRPVLFDRSGNAGPTVWCDGRVVGGWAIRAGGEVVYRLLEDLGAEVAQAMEAEAVRVQAAVAGTRVTPRFRTPLEAELSA
jgi:hypothetical protein